MWFRGRSTSAALLLPRAKGFGAHTAVQQAVKIVYLRQATAFELVHIHEMDHRSQQRAGRLAGPQSAQMLRILVNQRNVSGELFRTLEFAAPLAVPLKFQSLE